MTTTREMSRLPHAEALDAAFREFDRAIAKLFLLADEIAGDTARIKAHANADARDAALTTSH